MSSDLIKYAKLIVDLLDNQIVDESWAKLELQAIRVTLSKNKVNFTRPLGVAETELEAE